MYFPLMKFFFSFVLVLTMEISRKKDQTTIDEQRKDDREEVIYNTLQIETKLRWHLIMHEERTGIWVSNSLCVYVASRNGIEYF